MNSQNKIVRLISTTQSRSKEWAIYAASIWAFTFAAMSFYWAAGGTLGVDTLGNGIKEMALARELGFVMILWITAALKFLLGLLALVLLRRWGRSITRWMLCVSSISVGLGMVLYGGAGLIKVGLMEAGIVSIPSAIGSDAVHWYLMLWEPFWLAGGILFLIAVWQFNRGHNHRLLMR